MQQSNHCQSTNQFLIMLITLSYTFYQCQLEHILRHQSVWHGYFHLIQAIDRIPRHVIHTWTSSVPIRPPSLFGRQKSTIVTPSTNASNDDCMLAQQGYIFHVIWLDNVFNKWNMEVPKYNPLLQTKVAGFSSCIASLFCPNTIFWPKKKVLCCCTENCIHSY